MNRLEIASEGRFTPEMVVRAYEETGRPVFQGNLFSSVGMGACGMGAVVAACGAKNNPEGNDMLRQFGLSLTYRKGFAEGFDGADYGNQDIWEEPLYKLGIADGEESYEAITSLRQIQSIETVEPEPALPVGV